MVESRVAIIELLDSIQPLLSPTLLSPPSNFIRLEPHGNFEGPIKKSLPAASPSSGSSPPPYDGMNITFNDPIKEPPLSSNNMALRRYKRQKLQNGQSEEKGGSDAESIGLGFNLAGMTETGVEVDLNTHQRPGLTTLVTNTEGDMVLNPTVQSTTSGLTSPRPKTQPRLVEGLANSTSNGSGYNGGRAAATAAAAAPTSSSGHSRMLSSSGSALGGGGGGGGVDDWKQSFPKERLRKLAALYRAKGRELKHSGDRIARESNPHSSSDRGSPTALATALQMEAILLYVFAFWCDDQASKVCMVQNWQSIFGLLSFVRRAAEKSGIGIIVGLCLKMEALTIYMLWTHDQKTLNFKLQQQTQQQHGAAQNASAASPSPRAVNTAGSPSSTSDHSPGNSGSTSTTLFPPSNTQTSIFAGSNPSAAASAGNDLLKAFGKGVNDIFRSQRLNEDSYTYLSPHIIQSTLPLTWNLCIDVNRDVASTGFVMPIKPWEFAWPMEIQRTMAVPHLVAWCRCLLEEWSASINLGFESAVVDENV